MRKGNGYVLGVVCYLCLKGDYRRLRERRIMDKKASLSLDVPAHSRWKASASRSVRPVCLPLLVVVCLILLHG